MDRNYQIVQKKHQRNKNKKRRKMAIRSKDEHVRMNDNLRHQFEKTLQISDRIIVSHEVAIKKIGS